MEDKSAEVSSAARNVRLTVEVSVTEKNVYNIILGTTDEAVISIRKGRNPRLLTEEAMGDFTTVVVNL